MYSDSGENINPLGRVGVMSEQLKYSVVFRAYIYVKQAGGYKRISLGTHATLDEAAHAYNKAAIRYHGDAAKLNPVGT
jgi:DnaJ-class molecular chaperone